jgi:hypothetical protein
MRSQATAVRGWFGLIRKGSGTVVGLARLVECGKALDQAEMIASSAHHRIPEDMIRRGEVAKWVVPWKLADIIPLDSPVNYEHKSGAVIWVTFSSDVSQQLETYLKNRNLKADAITSFPTRKVNQVKTLPEAPTPKVCPVSRHKPDRAELPPLPEGHRKVIGRSVLSGGNIRNNHIKLASLMNAFPEDVIGGSNKSEVAPRKLEVDWGGPDKVMTDIDGTKSIFRARGWVRRFFAASGAQEGDAVIFNETAPYRVSVRLDRR